MVDIWSTLINGLNSMNFVPLAVGTGVTRGRKIKALKIDKNY